MPQLGAGGEGALTTFRSRSGVSTSARRASGRGPRVATSSKSEQVDVKGWNDEDLPSDRFVGDSSWARAARGDVAGLPLTARDDPSSSDFCQLHLSIAPSLHEELKERALFGRVSRSLSRVYALRAGQSRDQSASSRSSTGHRLERGQRAWPEQDLDLREPPARNAGVRRRSLGEPRTGVAGLSRSGDIWVRR